MIKSIQIVNRSIINIGRNWKLKDRRNGNICEKNQGAGPRKIFVVIFRDVLLLNVSHNSDSHCRDVQENLKHDPNSFLGVLM